MGALSRYSLLVKLCVSLTLCMCSAALGAGRAAAQGRNCLFVPGIGSLQKCKVLGDCTNFDTCISFTCSGEATCGPNAGELCSFEGGCSANNACTSSCPPE